MTFPLSFSIIRYQLGFTIPEVCEREVLNVYEEQGDDLELLCALLPSLRSNQSASAQMECCGSVVSGVSPRILPCVDL